MYRCLSPGAVGISGLSLDEQLIIASDAGFEGIDVPAQETVEAIEATSASAVREWFDRAGIRPGSWSLGDWRSDEGNRGLLADLPVIARALSSIGATRCTTWILSSSDLPYEDAWRWHKERFQPICRILSDFGCRLGIEYVGPHHLRTMHTHQFLCSAEEALRLAEDIGTGNVGLLFDAYHWYTAGETVATIAGFRQSDVVSVHVNDAPSGVPVDEQADAVRCMPGSTGIIDIAGFLKGLQNLGYDGPVTPEPFSGSPKGPDPIDIARATNQSLMAIWEQAGL